jgi:hypothetical protein
MALSKDLHRAVGREQNALGLFNPDTLRNQSAMENILLNAQAMENSGLVPTSRIQQLTAKAIEHGKSLGVIL